MHNWNSHQKRLFTGLLLGIPLLIVLTTAPLWVWFVLIAVSSGIGLWEFQRFFFVEGLPDGWQVFYILTGLLFPLGALWGGMNGLQCALFLSFSFAMVTLVIRFPRVSDGISRIMYFVFAWLYIPYFLSYVLLVGRMEDGRAWTVIIFLVIIASDAGAFYCGRKWGRHKLYEAVSPKKTIEGALGGLTAALIVGVLIGTFFLDEVTIGKLAFLSLAFSLVGQIGDLIESMIKRLSDKKDSSGLLPGHGGMLDRLDSLLFVFPAAWFLLHGLFGIIPL